MNPPVLPHVITTYALPCCSSSSTIGRVWSSAIVPTVALDQARLRSDLSVVLDEPESTGEPVDWRDEIVLPFKSRVKSAGGYYLIAPQEKLQSPDAKLFLNWLAALL